MSESRSTAVADVRRGLELGAARVLVPTTIRQGDVIDVRALVEHPMHTGLFRDPEGHPIPAHFINDVSVTYGEREVAHFAWTSGISRDPFVQFSLRADRESELRITWRDNRGGVYGQAVDLKFAT
jgi:sulfur-oxidizing protein SoxZ